MRVDADLKVSYILETVEALSVFAQINFSFRNIAILKVIG